MIEECELNPIIKRWAKLREKEENIHKYYYAPNIWIPHTFIQEIWNEIKKEIFSAWEKMGDDAKSQREFEAVLTKWFGDAE